MCFTVPADWAKVHSLRGILTLCKGAVGVFWARLALRMDNNDGWKEREPGITVLSGHGDDDDNGSSSRIII